MARRARPKKGKAEAKRPLARKSPKDSVGKVRDLEKRLAEAVSREAEASKREAEALGKLQTRDHELAEALEQQTATSQILRLINNSSANLAPVFEGILESALRLAGADYGATLVLEGEFLHLARVHGTTPEWDDVAERLYPLRVSSNRPSGEAVLERRPVFVAD